MADVYHRLTGNPPAVYASTGPMNLMISKASAYYDNPAFFAITGNLPTTQLNTGALPEAFSLMRNGRPGPVHMDMPYNLYIETAPVSVPEPPVNNSTVMWRPRLSESAVERVLDMLVKSPRPLKLAGGGIRAARAIDELKVFAGQIGIPVTGTWQMPPIPEVRPTFGQRKVRQHAELAGTGLQGAAAGVRVHFERNRGCAGTGRPNRVVIIRHSGLVRIAVFDGTLQWNCNRIDIADEAFRFHRHGDLARFGKFAASLIRPFVRPVCQSQIIKAAGNV